MCGPHASQSSSVASHPTYGLAKPEGRSQTRLVEALILFTASAVFSYGASQLSLVRKGTG